MCSWSFNAMFYWKTLKEKPPTEKLVRLSSWLNSNQILPPDDLTIFFHCLFCNNCMNGFYKVQKFVKSSRGGFFFHLTCESCFYLVWIWIEFQVKSGKSEDLSVVKIDPFAKHAFVLLSQTKKAPNVKRFMTSCKLNDGSWLVIEKKFGIL